MADDRQLGRVLEGDPEQLLRTMDAWSRIPVDLDLEDQRPAPLHFRARTIERETQVSAPGTFSGKKTRTLQLLPSEQPGWWFDRTDQPFSSPIKVSSRNVWTTGDVVSNIVLRAGSPHNYIRLSEHIIALRAGLHLDNLLIKLDSGDPPLFDHGSRDLVEKLDEAGRRELDQPVAYYTVREKVTIGAKNGGFLSISPATADDPGLHIDCTRDFPNAIGQQRIRFPVNDETIRRGAEARTNSTNQRRWFCLTIGRIFADIRNLGYNGKNVLIAGRRRYVNTPRLLHNGKSLEAAWHRAVLDLLASIALIEEGRFLGHISCYKGSHYLDVEAIKLLYAHDLLVPFQPNR